MKIKKDKGKGANVSKYGPSTMSAYTNTFAPKVTL